MLENLDRRDFLALTGASVVPLTGCLHSTNRPERDGWRMYGYDARNTAHSRDETAPGEKPTLDWNKTYELAETTTRGEITRFSGSTPAVTDGSMYVGSRGRESLLAYDTETGEELWRYEMGQEVNADPAVVDGTVYIGEPKRLAIDAETGEERWRFETERKAGTPTVYDGTVYLVVGDELYAIDAENGEERWSTVVGEAASKKYPPAVEGNTVYFSAGSVYALNRASGEVEWTFEPDSDDVGYSGQTVSDGVLYTCTKNKLCAVDTDEQACLWEFEPGQTTDSDVAVDNERAYVSTFGLFGSGELIDEEKIVHAVDIETGEEIWKHSTYASLGRGDGTSLTPSVLDGVVYVSSLSDLVALDAENGEKIWGFGAPRGTFRSNPVIVDGDIYVSGSTEIAMKYSESGTAKSVDGMINGWMMPFERPHVIDNLTPGKGSVEWSSSEVFVTGLPEQPGIRSGKVFLGSEVEEVRGRYFPNGPDADAVDTHVKVAEGTLSIKHDENSAEIEGVTTDDRGELFDVDLGDREEWRYDSFGPELAKILEAEKNSESVSDEVVADFVNKQFLMFTGKDPVVLSAEDIGGFGFRIVEMFPDGYSGASINHGVIINSNVSDPDGEDLATIALVDRDSRS